ncbi:MAG: hypothetical protein M3282_02500, partial [Gemmatimonadota bacterium]|nr:hypothetical protein [Gemmatimonadota bacterium]
MLSGQEPFTTRRGLVGAVLMALVLGALWGCGDDDSAQDRGGAPKSGPTPSKREFIARADEVCADLERKSERQSQKEPESPEELVRQARRVTSLHHEGLRRLEAIGLPADGDERRGAREFVDSIRALSKPVEALERAATQVESAEDKDSRERGEAAVLNLQEALINIEQGDKKSHKVAKRYGLK